MIPLSREGRSLLIQITEVDKNRLCISLWATCGIRKKENPGNFQNQNSSHFFRRRNSIIEFNTVKYRDALLDEQLKHVWSFNTVNMYLSVSVPERREKVKATFKKVIYFPNQ